MTLREARLRGAAHAAGAGLREVTGGEEETLGAKVGEEVALSVVPSSLINPGLVGVQTKEGGVGSEEGEVVTARVALLREEGNSCGVPKV